MIKLTSLFTELMEFIVFILVGIFYIFVYLFGIMILKSYYYIVKKIYTFLAMLYYEASKKENDCWDELGDKLMSKARRYNNKIIESILGDKNV